MRWEGTSTTGGGPLRHTLKRWTCTDEIAQSIEVASFPVTENCTSFVAFVTLGTAATPIESINVVTVGAVTTAAPAARFAVTSNE